jgi:hypothetical protein
MSARPVRVADRTTNTSPDANSTTVRTPDGATDHGRH